MTGGRLRARVTALFARWNDAARLRAVVVLVVALAGAVGYGVFLNRGAPRGDWHGSPIGDWLFWKVGAMWAWGVFLSAACVSAGHLVLTRVFRVTGLPTLETVVQSAALGLLVFVLGMYAGGFARLYNPVFAVLWPAVMLAAGARSLLAFARERVAAWKAAPVPRDPVSRAVALGAMVFGVVGLLFVYLEAMTPDTINFDASWSHLPVAVDYARAGRIVRFDADYNRNFPHLASIVHTWPMIVPSWGVFTEPPIRWMLALHLEFFVFVWSLAGVAAMASWLLESDRVRATWAAFFLFPAIFVYDCNLGGAADHYLAFFAPPLFLAAVRAAPRFGARAGALVGAYAAGALLAKYQAVYLIIGVGLVFGGLWLAAAFREVRARRAPLPPEGRVSAWPELIQAPLALGGAFALVVAPHFLKNWVFYRNPMYPFMQDVFASRPTTPHAAYLFEWLFKDYNWRPHGTFVENVIDALRLCFVWSFQPHYSFTHNVPNAGSLFTLCLPMALVVRAPRRLWLGYAAGMGALFAWAMIFRVDRHLQTFMPLVVAATAAVLVRAWELGWIARVGLVALVGLQVVWGGDAAIYAGFSRIQSSLEMIRSTYEGRVKTRFAGFRANDRAIGAALPKDAKVLLHMYRPNLGIDRDLVLDWAGQQGLILYEDIHGPRSLYDFYKSIGVTHLLWFPGHRPASTKQEDVLFADFTHRYVGEGRRFGGEMLAALPAQPPPPDHPYRVLALGLNGYADGLYPVEALKTYEAIPGNREKFAPPETPLPHEPSAQAELANLADAVCIGERYRAHPLLKGRIDALFEPAVSFARAFSVDVRHATAAPPRPAPTPGAAPTGDDDVPQHP